MPELKDEILALLRKAHQEGRAPVSTESLYKQLVAAGFMEFSKDAELYPTHPLRLRIAKLIQELHSEGALSFMEGPTCKDLPSS